MRDLLLALREFIDGHGELPTLTSTEAPPTLSDKEVVILGLLLAQPNAYGLDLVRRADGDLKRGTVYVTLNRMEDKGLISSSTEEVPDGELPRRRYRVTGLGERCLRVYQISQAAGALAMGVTQ